MLQLSPQRATWLVWLAFACLTLTASSVCAQPDEQAYRAKVDQALVELRLQHWGEARVLFGEAHEMLPNAQTLRALGTTAFELRLYARALDELEAALAHPVRPLDVDQRTQVTQLIEQARAFVAVVELSELPSDGKLMVDGAPIQPAADLTFNLDPGEHELIVTFGDGARWQRMLTAVSGRRSKLHIQREPQNTTEPAPPTKNVLPDRPTERRQGDALPTRRKRWGMGLLSAGVATGLVGAGLGWATAQQHETVQRCKPDCEPAEADRGRRLQLSANLLFGAAGALALTGGWVWLTAPRAVSLDVTLERGSVLGQLRWAL